MSVSDRAVRSFRSTPSRCSVNKCQYLDVGEPLSTLEAFCLSRVLGADGDLMAGTGFVQSGPAGLGPRVLSKAVFPRLLHTSQRKQPWGSLYQSAGPRPRLAAQLEAACWEATWKAQAGDTMANRTQRDILIPPINITIPRGSSGI